MFRYYFRNRPPSIGTHPKNPVKVEGYNTRQIAPISGSLSWGYVEYDTPLSNEEIKDYELFEDIIVMPDMVKDLVEYAHDEGIEEAIKVCYEDKQYGICLSNYLKSIGLLIGSRENIKNGFIKIVGV